MVNNISICKKYAELSRKYINCQIDDYDTFVQARVVEYYINAFPDQSDNIYAQVAKAIAEKSDSYSIISYTANEDTVDNVKDNVKVESYYLWRPQTTLKPICYLLKKAFPYIVSTVGASIGIVAWIRKRGKRK